MPHLRNRDVLQLLLKKMSFSPSICIQGVRQSGKSFLVRELLTQKQKGIVYKSFDQRQTRVFAENNPGVFLEQHSDASTLVIDEAQKVPFIFDEVKYAIDQERRPGKYILLGSTEFSKRTMIRESLTGRTSMLKVFPFTISEVLSAPSKPFLDFKAGKFLRRDLLRHLGSGGMPAIFAVRSEGERKGLIKDWFETTVNRDLLNIPKMKLDPELGMMILEKVVSLEEPTAGQIAKSLRKDLRRVKAHLSAFEILFVLHRINPALNSSGKSLYFICDVGLASYLGASFERKLQTWVLQEALSRQEIFEEDYRVCFYRTPKGRRIDFVIEKKEESIAIQIFSHEKFDIRSLELLKSFGLRSEKPVKLIGLGSQQLVFKKEKIIVYPWENII